MAKYILIYHEGGQFDTKQQQAEHMQKYQQWLADLGENALEPGNPLKDTKFVSTSGNVENKKPAMGYTVISAENIAEAELVARNCPFLDSKNSYIEVAEIIDMSKKQ